MSTVCARRGLFSAEAIQAAPTENRKMNDELRMTNDESGGAEVINRPSGASRARVVGQPCSPTGILEESSRSPTTGACERAREGGKPIRDRDAYFRAWRIAMFGGDYDPVRAAVEDAVKAFSSRQPERDRELWLKVANEIGYDAFLELYREHLSIMEDCRRRRNPLRNPAAAFQTRLNLHTGHGKRKGGAA